MLTDVIRPIRWQQHLNLIYIKSKFIRLFFLQCLSHLSPNSLNWESIGRQDDIIMAFNQSPLLPMAGIARITVKTAHGSA